MMDRSDDADRKLDDASAAVITSSISERKRTEMETNGKDGLDLLVETVESRHCVAKSETDSISLFLF